MPFLKTLVLHIGVPKTGSSLIQRAMRALKPQLQRRGIAAIARSQFLKIPGQTAWAPYGRSDQQKGRFFEALQALVEEELARTRRGTTLLLSNETASGRARDFGDPFWPGARGGVGELVEALRPRKTHVIVYVRRQDRLLESLYMERIHRGTVLEWPEWQRSVCSDSRVRYTDLVEAIGEVPTLAAVTVRPFETIRSGAPAFLTDFFDIVGTGSDLVDGLGPEVLSPVNPSYTEPAWRAAMALNALLDTPEQVNQVRRFLRQLFPTDTYPKVQLLTTAERERLLKTYRPENERFFARYLPEYPTDAYWSAESLALLEQAPESSASRG